MGVFDGAKALKPSGLIAGSGLTGASVQYKFVKLSADKTVVLCAATTDVPIGILQAPVVATGDPVEVVAVGESMLQADAALQYGYQLATSADGQGAQAVAGQYVVGQVLDVAGATTAATLVTVLVNCASPTLL